ncbi:small subunit ribosomal protein S27e [Pancytospora epiphaga]|nr:small subunit ribosomal protein S27e [Pancytospora epiphaga]
MWQSLSIPAYTPAIHKKKRVFRQTKTHFLDTVCGDCGETMITYSHSQTDVHCKNCSALLIKSTGGAARLVGNVKVRRAENTY